MKAYPQTRRVIMKRGNPNPLSSARISPVVGIETFDNGLR
jgi:hypothetical protein